MGPNGTLAQATVARLTQAVESGRWTNSDRLPAERALAEELHVSRPTLREALRELAIHGMITPRRGAGWYVSRPNFTKSAPPTNSSDLNPLTVDKLREARLALEPSIAMLAAVNRTTADIRHLLQIFDEMKTSKSEANLLTADVRFHNEIAKATANGYFLWALKPLLSNLTELKQDIEVPSDTRQGILRHHKELLLAIIGGEQERAAQVMARHITASLRSSYEK